MCVPSSCNSAIVVVAVRAHCLLTVFIYLYMYINKQSMKHKLLQWKSKTSARKICTSQMSAIYEIYRMTLFSWTLYWTGNNCWREQNYKNCVTWYHFLFNVFSGRKCLFLWNCFNLEIKCVVRFRKMYFRENEAARA